MKAIVTVTPKPSVLDPQGKAVQQSLRNLSFQQVSGVRIGKHIELELQTNDRDVARGMIQEMCVKLLANPVIEDFHFELEEA